MKKADAVITYLIGNKDCAGTEKYFVTVACLVSFVFLMLLAVIHSVMSLKPAATFIAGASSLVVFGIYLMARFRKDLFLPKLTLTIYGLLMLDLAWYFKFLSNGPVLFVILVYGALIIWVWEGRSLLILLAVYYLNLAMLMAIEFNAPEYLLSYPDITVRSLDIYISFFLVSAFVIFLLYLVKTEYISQKEDAMKSDRLKSAFLANISHEIRTPMNAIVGFSELLCDKNIDPDRSRYFKSIIHDSCNNLSRLFDDILDLSRIEAGDMPVKKADFSLCELIMELVEWGRLELNRRKKNGVELDFSVPSNDIIIHSDAFRLKQILSNLLDNAMKFTSRGKISLGCSIVGKELVFTVTDTGTGIPVADQGKIFDRFVKFDYRGNNSEGSGIGLSIVDRIVRLLNGRVWLTSVYGQGSSFFVSIPCTEPASSETSPASPESRPSSPPAMSAS